MDDGKKLLGVWLSTGLYRQVEAQKVGELPISVRIRRLLEAWTAPDGTVAAAVEQWHVDAQRATAAQLATSRQHDPPLGPAPIRRRPNDRTPVMTEDERAAILARMNRRPPSRAREDDI